MLKKSMTVILAIGAQSAPSGAPAPGAVVELAGVARHADGPDEVAVRDGAAQPHQRNVVLKVLVVVVGVNDDSGQRSADLIRTRGTLILFSKEQAPKSKVGTTFEKGGGEEKGSICRSLRLGTLLGDFGAESVSFGIEMAPKVEVRVPRTFYVIARFCSMCTRSSSEEYFAFAESERSSQSRLLLRLSGWRPPAWRLQTTS